MRTLTKIVIAFVWLALVNENRIPRSKNCSKNATQKNAQPNKAAFLESGMEAIKPSTRTNKPMTNQERSEKKRF